MKPPIVVPTTFTPLVDDKSNAQIIWYLFWNTIGTFINLLPRQFIGTHANRINFAADDYNDGTTYYETDRKVIYMVVNQVWGYGSGTYRNTLSEIPVLSTADAGFLFFVTDYAHLLRWSGTAWAFADSDVSGRVEMHLVDPSPATGWALCDGSTVTYLKSNGTTQVGYVLPDWTTAANKARFASLAGTVGAIAAVAPGFSGTPPTFTGTAGTTSGPSATSIFDQVIFSNPTATSTHTHDFTPAGTISLAGTTIDTTGAPAGYGLRPWFRL